jgi:uncharacterized protein YcfL
MKKFLVIAITALLVTACGKKPAEQATTELSSEQELVVADSLSNDIEEARQNLEAETQQNLTEIDSLLENF